MKTYFVPKNFVDNFDELLEEYLESVSKDKQSEIRSHFSLKTKRGIPTKFGLRNRERMIALYDLIYHRTNKFEEAWISHHTRNLLTPKRFKLFYLNFLLYHKFIKKISNHQAGIKAIGYISTNENVEEYKSSDEIKIGYRWKYLNDVRKSLQQFEISKDDMVSGLKNYILRCKYDGYNYTNEDVKKINISNYKEIIKGDESIEKYIKPSISNLISGHIRISRARYNGRISSTFTNIPREIRNKIKLKSGDPISELDLSSSQWAIFMMIADKYYGGVSDEFREDIRDNLFYDKIKNFHHLKSRNEAKTLSYSRALFFEGSKGAHIPVIKHMLEPYPVEAEILIKMKNDFYRGTHKFKKLKVYNLSQLLQTIEAMIFIDSGLVYCLENGIPAYTVHDSIIVPAERVDEVKDVIVRKIKELFEVSLVQLRFKESIIL